MRKFGVIFMLFLTVSLNAQQTNNYGQYTLNAYGMNPAYPGSHPGLEFYTGRRMQWVGFDNNPRTTFLSATYTIKPRFSYRAWHGLGAYVEEDKRGLFLSKSTHVSYAYHTRIVTGKFISFGLAVGLRTVGYSTSLQSSYDPALQNLSKNLNIYPDFIPGFRFYSKKMYLDLSVRQLYKNQLKQGSKESGTPSKLVPTFYFTYGRRIHLGSNEYIIIPNVHIQQSLRSLPLVNFGLLAYYRKKVGLGVNYRVNNALAAQLHVRFLKNAICGISYEYTTSKFRLASANTLEIILGFTPMGGDDDRSMRTNVAACPDFDF